jgi:hypothetical protein
MIHYIVRQRSLQHDALDEIVTLVDRRLEKNRAAGSPKHH